MLNGSYESLAAWEQAVRLVERVYRVTGDFPADEKSGLAATLRRAAAAIPGRIADAHGQADPSAAVNMIEGVLGQLRELHTHLIVSHRLRFLSSWRLGRTRKLCVKIERLLDALAEDCRAEAAQEATTERRAA